MVKKILVVSNMYPSHNDVSFGVFVRNIVNILENVNDIKLDLSVIKGRSGRIIKSFKYLTFLVKTVFKALSGKYDFIYIHFISHSYIPFLLIEPLIKCKIVLHVHGGDIVQNLEVSNFYFLIKRYISNRGLKRADIVIIPSNYYSKLLVNDYGVDKNKIIVFASGGIDLDKFYPVRKLNNIMPFTLGYVGRLTESKGLYTLLDAVKKLKNKKIDFNVDIVGRGPLESAIKTFIDIESMSNIVTLYPPVEHDLLVDFYNKFDLFIFPTKFESLGLVGLEAMACGIPVIGSRVGGLNDYIENSINGFLFDETSSDDLVEKISYYYDLEEVKRVQLKENALLTASKYNKDKEIKKLLEVFN